MSIKTKIKNSLRYLMKIISRFMIKTKFFAKFKVQHTVVSYSSSTFAFQQRTIKYDNKEGPIGSYFGNLAKVLSNQLKLPSERLSLKVSENMIMAPVKFLVSIIKIMSCLNFEVPFIGEDTVDHYLFQQLYTNEAYRSFYLTYEQDVLTQSISVDALTRKLKQYKIRYLFTVTLLEAVFSLLSMAKSVAEAFMLDVFVNLIASALGLIYTLFVLAFTHMKTARQVQESSITVEHIFDLESSVRSRRMMFDAMPSLCQRYGQEESSLRYAACLLKYASLESDEEKETYFFKTEDSMKPVWLQKQAYIAKYKIDVDVISEETLKKGYIQHVNSQLKAKKVNIKSFAYHVYKKVSDGAKPLRMFLTTIRVLFVDFFEMVFVPKPGQLLITFLVILSVTSFLAVTNLWAVATIVAVLIILQPLIDKIDQFFKQHVIRGILLSPTLRIGGVFEKACRISPVNSIDCPEEKDYYSFALMSNGKACDTSSYSSYDNKSFLEKVS